MEYLQQVSATGAALFRRVFYQIQQQALGTIKESGADIVASQFQMCLVNLRPGQAGARQQILVNAYRPIYLPALAQQVAQRDVGLQCFTVDFEGIDKGVNRAVRAPVQEIIQPLVILARYRTDPGARAAPPQPPANADGDEQEREYEQVSHRL